MKDEKQQEIDRYLENQINMHCNYSMYKRIIDVMLLLIAIFLGGLVVVNIGTKQFNADQLSALTGLSAIVLTVIRWGRFQEQAKWNKLKQRQFEMLLRKLKYESISVPEISANISQIQENLERIRIWLDTPGQTSDMNSKIHGNKIGN